MPTYNILQDYGIPEGQSTDRLTFSPAAAIAVYRRKNPVTYSRKKKGSFTNISSYGAKLRDVVVIVDDITSITTTSNKSSHVSTMSAQLKPGANYVSELLPGDYVFVWMTQDKETLRTVLQNLDTGKPANEWNHGLKFFGKVQNCRKQTRVDPAAGTKHVSFMLTAGGFTELDASVYYEPHLALPTQGAVQTWMQYFGIAISSVLSKEMDGGIGTNSVLPELLKILYGQGLPKNARVDSDTLARIGGSSARLTEGLDNPNAFVIPKEVGAVFGVTEGSKPNGAVAWSDIMEFVHGVQKYPQSGPPGTIMNPIAAKTDGTFRFTGYEQMGTFQPHVSAFVGQKTTWSILEQFVNKTVNEMYTALRPRPDGSVAPTLVVRQLPFSSGLISEQYLPEDELSSTDRAKERDAKATLGEVGGPESIRGKRLLAHTAATTAIANTTNWLEAKGPPQILRTALTRFVELPRWQIPSIFVKSFDVGRSDALRFNYIHVYGEAGFSEAPNASFVRNPPIRDDLDIERSGLRPYMATVPCSPKDLKNGSPGAWMDLLADILMNQELTLNGLINMYGVQQPIAPGDNIEYDGIIAHIEAVNHLFNVAPNGVVSFMTNIEFSHGVSGEQQQDDDYAKFAGLKFASLSSHDPGITQDGTGPTTGSGTDASNLTDQGWDIDGDEARDTRTTTEGLGIPPTVSNGVT